MAKDMKQVGNSAAADDIAYLLEIPHAPDTNGLIRLVNWCKGRGVLDRRAVADIMPDQLNAQTFEDKPGVDVDVLMGEVAGWWERRGATVTKTTAAKAQIVRDELEQIRVAPAPVADEKVPAPDEDEKIKVSALAKETAMTSKEIIELLAEAGIEAKAAGSKVAAASARMAIATGNPEALDGGVDLAPHEKTEE